MTFFLFPKNTRILFLGLFIFLLSATAKSEEIQSELQDERVQLIVEQNIEEEYENNEDDDFSACSKQNILGVIACRKICGPAAKNETAPGEGERGSREQLNFCIESKQFEGTVCDCTAKKDSTPPEICDATLSRVFTDLESEEDCADFCTAQEKLPYGCRVNVDSDFVPTCACFPDPETESLHAEKRGNGQGLRFRRVCKKPRKNKNKYCKKKKPKNKRPKPDPLPPQVEGEEVENPANSSSAPKYPEKPILPRLKLLVKLLQTLQGEMKDLGEGFGSVTTSVEDLIVCVKDDKGIFDTKVPDDADKTSSTTEKPTDKETDADTEKKNR